MGRARTGGTRIAWLRRRMPSRTPVILLLALAACGEAEPGPSAEPLDEGVGVEPPRDPGKADHQDLAFQAFDDAIGDRGRTAQRRLITSNGDYRQLFGRDAPALVDFAHEWVVFYSAGTQPTTGYVPEVRSVRVTSDWRLSITTALHAPGPHCLVMPAPTAPRLLVKMRRPAGSIRSVQWHRADTVRDCEAMPPPPPPPPPGRVCGPLECRYGTYCHEQGGIYQCLRYPTCALEPPSCGPGTRCEDVAAACVQEPCPPSVASCEPYRCPPMGTIACRTPLPIWRVDECTGPYHDWIVDRCPGVTFTY